MKFPYIPISYAIADVRSEMKRMNQAGDIFEEDCINWAVETLREVGGGNYQQKPFVLNVCNNTATLPKDFYVLDSVWLCADESVSEPGDEIIWFSQESRGYRRLRILFPGDAMTGSLYTRSGTCVGAEPGLATYIIRHPNQFRCSINRGTIAGIYIALPTAEDGEMLMQDEIYTIKAVKAYMKRMLLAEKYYAGQIGQNIWNDINREYDINLDQAQAIFKFPDPVDNEAMGYIQDHRYDAFKLR